MHRVETGIFTTSISQSHEDLMALCVTSSRTEVRRWFFERWNQLRTNNTQSSFEQNGTFYYSKGRI